MPRPPLKLTLVLFHPSRQVLQRFTIRARDAKDAERIIQALRQRVLQHAAN